MGHVNPNTVLLMGQWLKSPHNTIHWWVVRCGVLVVKARVYAAASWACALFLAILKPERYRKYQRNPDLKTARYDAHIRGTIKKTHDFGPQLTPSATALSCVGQIIYFKF
eukprot:1160481-Pelagomonas_calceolata.AAC.5